MVQIRKIWELGIRDINVRYFHGKGNINEYKYDICFYCPVSSVIRNTIGHYGNFVVCYREVNRKVLLCFAY